MTILACGLSTRAAAENELVDPFEVISALDHASEMNLWPGFYASTYPIAIYDGERTLLLRHPDPPKKFEPTEGLSIAFNRARVESTGDSLIVTVLKVGAD